MFRSTVDIATGLAKHRGRNAKRDLIAVHFKALSDDDLRLAVAYLTGTLPQGKIGIGYSLLKKWSVPGASDDALLHLCDVDEAFQALATTSGAGSQGRKRALWEGLLARSTSDEQVFLSKLLTGELRQGALEGVVGDALALSLDMDPSDVRRAAMLGGSLFEIAAVLRKEGSEGLEHFCIQLFRPLQPMLAEPSSSVGEAWEKLGQARYEYKLDGIRVQVHRQGDQVRVFSRSLRDMTSALPEVCREVALLRAESIVLDGEVLAFDEEGMPKPFQITMRRAGKRSGDAHDEEEMPLRSFFFDCVHLNGRDLVDLPLSERMRILSAELPEQLLMPSASPLSEGEASRFYEEAIAKGHEGIMVKDSSAAYAAGSRGASWLKIKPTHTVDLVVLGAEWGSGRRRGWLSNLHLGARDEETGAFVMVGKTFKGLTDKLLQWQTETFPGQELSRDGHVVYLRPHFVVEIAFNDVQQSSQYAGGVALRFARVKGYRSDKKPEEADTIRQLRELCPAF